MGGMKTAVVTLSLLVGTPVALLGAWAGWSEYANSRADAEATAFCNAIHRGDPVEPLYAREGTPGGPKWASPGDKVAGFHFQGFFHGSVCRVDVVDGKATTVVLEMSDFD